MSAKHVDLDIVTTSIDINIDISFLNRAKIYLLNNDTAIELFVCIMVSAVFNKNIDESRNITSKAHLTGEALLGEYSITEAEHLAERGKEFLAELNQPIDFRIEKV